MICTSAATWGLVGSISSAGTGVTGSPEDIFYVMRHCIGMGTTQHCSMCHCVSVEAAK